jgi:hypothetical protein
MLQSVWRGFMRYFPQKFYYNHRRGSARPRPSVHFVCFIIFNILSQQSIAEFSELRPGKRLEQSRICNFSRYNYRRGSGRPRPSVGFVCLVIMLNIELLS